MPCPSLRLTFLALAAAGSLAAPAQAAGPNVLQLGVGTLSCRYWLSTPQIEGEGNAWLLGYWTARNVTNAADHQVGSHSDGNGILTRMRRLCREHPTAQLEDTANALYGRMMHDRHQGTAAAEHRQGAAGAALPRR